MNLCLAGRQLGSGDLLSADDARRGRSRPRSPPGDSAEVIGKTATGPLGWPSVSRVRKWGVRPLKRGGRCCTLQAFDVEQPPKRLDVLTEEFVKMLVCPEDRTPLALAD